VVAGAAGAPATTDHRERISSFESTPVSCSLIRWFIFMSGAPMLAMTMTFVWVLVIYGLAINRDYFDPEQRGRSLAYATTTTPPDLD
jgi:hypothetical protein